MNPRATAAQIISQTSQKKFSLTNAFSDYLPSDLPGKQIAQIKHLCYETLRWYYQLSFIANEVLYTPLKNKDHDIYCLILIGLYQIKEGTTPAYAVVSETVNAAVALKKVWAKGLVNKTLRIFIEKQNALTQKALSHLESAFSHPQWLIEELQKAWPNDWQNILSANNTHAPMCIRVNRQKIDRNNYLKLLVEKKIPAKAIEELPDAIQLENPISVNDLPGFFDGMCSIQDSSGQKVVELLDLKPKQRVLDACSAPGSKTSHILEKEPNLAKLVAIDKDALRIQKVKENIDRLGLAHDQLQLTLSDASHTQQWWDGHPFDRILLDAPCSGTGVIRRHPDIKILRTQQDIAQHRSIQAHLLNTLWKLLKPNGKLLYSTCSVLPQENEQAISQFLASHPDAKLSPINFSWAIKTTKGCQLLPQENSHDGFFYALIIKN